MNGWIKFYCPARPGCSAHKAIEETQRKKAKRKVRADKWISAPVRCTAWRRWMAAFLRAVDGLSTQPTEEILLVANMRIVWEQTTRTKRTYIRFKLSLNSDVSFTSVAVCHHSITMFRVCVCVCVFASSRTSNYDIKLMHILSKLFFVGALVAQYEVQGLLQIGWLTITAAVGTLPPTATVNTVRKTLSSWIYKNMQIHFGSFSVAGRIKCEDSATIPIWFFNFAVTTSIAPHMPSRAESTSLNYSLSLLFSRF